MNIAARDDLVAHYGLTRKSAYCTSNSKQNQDIYWTCGACGGSTSVIGYWLLIQRVDANFQPVTTTPWDGSTMIAYAGEPKHKFVYDLVNSSDSNRKLQVLFTDAIIRNGPAGSFSTVPSGVGGAPHQSSHLGPKDQPMGANLCYTDGHVEWKDMRLLKARYGGASVPLHYW